MTDTEETNSGVLTRRIVIYCGACGMPVEYCEYGPDYETHCVPWLKQHHPELVVSAASAEDVPTEPWTTEERLTAFYEKYVPEKVDSIPGLLEKYAGKEDKLFQALVSKYGPEPEDPYYAAEDSGGGGSAEPAAGVGSSRKRRGVGAKKTQDSGDASQVRVVIAKVTQKKRRTTTIVSGMDEFIKMNNAGVKLKDVSKQFSKKFAGSSSVNKSNEISVQGDHVYEAAELLIDQFHVPEECIFLDVDGEIMPLK